MSTAAALRYTAAEYLAMEQASAERHEFVNGEIIAMAGASPAHELAVMNLGTTLNNLLAGRPCRAFGSNLRVRISETGMYAYPDATVVCGQLELDEATPPSLLNPRVIVEVLSESTEAYDRGAKAAHYRRLASLDAYLLVSTAERRVELYSREDDGAWRLTEAQGSGRLAVPSLQVELALDDVYAFWESLPAPVEPRPRKGRKRR